MKLNLFLIVFLELFGSGQAFSWNTPVRVSPANGSNSNGGTTLDWNAVQSSLAYEYQIEQHQLLIPLF